MLKVRTMKQIPTSRTIASFRSCRSYSGANQGMILDQGRIMLGYTELLTHEAHRKWRNGLWRLRR